MDNLIEKIKNISFYKDKIFWICMLISLFFFGFLIRPEYATDTYSDFGNDWTYIFGHFASLGRFVTAGFWAILIGALKMKFTLAYLLSWGLGIIFFAMAMYKLYYIIKEDISHKVVASLVSLLIIVNIFSLELFMYFEKGILALSVLLNVLALEQMIKVFKGSKKNVVYVLIYMILANCCYQGTVALFVALAVVYIVKYAKNIGDFIKKNILVAILYAVPALINFLFVKFAFASDRVSGQSSLMDSITLIISSIKSIFVNSFGIMPKYVFLASLAIVAIVYLYCCIKNKDTWKEFCYNIFKYIYVVVAVIFATVAPQLLQNTVYMVPRDTYTMASLLGITILLAYTILKKDSKLMNYAVIIVASVFIAIQYYNFVCIVSDHYTMNQMDKAVAVQIEENIKNYEEESGNHITKVIYYQDANLAWQYPGLRTIGDANIKASFTRWSRNNIILLMTGRNMEELLEQKEEYVQYFKQKNWDYFDADEQLIFDKDTVHICCF